LDAREKCGWILIGGAVVALCGCISIYHVSEKPPPDGDGIFILKSNGADVSAGAAYSGGRDPYIERDRRVLFVKQASGSYQVFRGSQQLTNSTGNKSNPVASGPSIAYLRETPDGIHVVVQNASGSVLREFQSDANGLALYDNGARLVYSQRDGVYVAPASSEGPAARIVDCSSFNPGGCGPVAVSRDGRYLGWYGYLLTTQARLSWIEIFRVGTWQAVVRITPESFCPTCSPGNAGTPEDLGAFDFSRDDKELYATVRVKGSAGEPPGNRQELFRVQMDLAAVQPTVSRPERLTNNVYPDFHPSVYRFP
jgi:hypothetical protein